MYDYEVISIPKINKLEVSYKQMLYISRSQKKVVKVLKYYQKDYQYTQKAHNDQP